MRLEPTLATCERQVALGRLGQATMLDDWSSSAVTCPLWRNYCDALHATLIRRWVGSRRFSCSLKTDLFDETVGLGLLGILGEISSAVHGIDLSEIAVECAARRHPGLVATRADVRQLDLADESVDFIFSNSTLDHFASRAEICRALRELVRILQPGGQMIVTLDNPRNPFVAVRNMLPQRPLRALGLVPYFVGATLPMDQLAGELRACGLEVTERAYLMHVPRVAVLHLCRLLPRSSRVAGGVARFLLSAGEQAANFPTAAYTGPEGTMLLAGAEQWSDYLRRRFFPRGSEARVIGRYRTWQLPRLLRRHRGGVDIAVARVDVFSARFFAGTEYLRVPDWIGMTAPVPASNEELACSSNREDRRCIKRKQLRWRVSHTLEDLHLYLERDYLPYMRARHGGNAYFQPAAWLRRKFMQGGLLWVEKDGVALAGTLFERRGDVLHLWSTACVGGDERLLRERALAASYLFIFEYARSVGAQTIDFRGCRPSTQDGLFHVKKKWGGVVREHAEIVYDCLVHWAVPNERLKHFLRHTPLIFRDGEHLSAVRAKGGTHRLPLGIHRWYVPAEEIGPGPRLQAAE